MGGSTGGRFSTNELNTLEKKAKEKLKTSERESNKHIFISFANEDKDEINLLRGQAKNDNSSLHFDDYSLKKAFNSIDADYIKQGIREKIDRCSVVIVYLSDHAASSKWVNWEIEEAIKKGKKVIGVYKGDNVPTKIPFAFKTNNCEAIKWEQKALMRAIDNSNTSRESD